MSIAKNTEVCAKKAIKENKQIESKRNLINQKVYTESINNVTIPVVVHFYIALKIIFLIAEYFLDSVLNEDFRRTNSDAINAHPRFNRSLI